jgi:APA family basic amino acid/polyamine antiporter
MRFVPLSASYGLVLLWSSGFRELLTYIGFTLGLSTAATVVGWPWAPALYLLAVAAMTLSAIVQQPIASLWGLATILGGWLIWAGRCRSESVG